MNILIAGGSGFIGSALENYLNSKGHTVWILTRRPSNRRNDIHWDGSTSVGWEDRLDEMDAVVNLTGFGLEHWPWTKFQKQKFLQSRLIPAHALTSAIERSTHQPKVFLQISGINYYGELGDTIADELTPPGNDFLAQLTVQWEAASQPVEKLGVRFIVARSAVVLDRHAGMFPLMALPTRLFIGGRFGNGTQAVPWIHLIDHIRAIGLLLENVSMHGVFNLISPAPTSNDEFMRSIAREMHRPFWFPVPAFLLHTVLGEMSTLLVNGRYSQPKRLLDVGFEFRYPTIDAALGNLLSL
jgi:uncharacterized protein (TIGR01777 family)